MNKYHIYIPSKGRGDNCLTAKILKEAGLKFTIVIEPQDYSEYKKNFATNELWVMKESNRGIAHARNECMKLSIARGEESHWQMDDDIKRFSIRRNEKNEKVTPIECIKPVEEMYDKFSGLGMIAHRYTSYAFAQTKDISFNQNPCSSFIVRNLLGPRWKQGTVVDADYAMKVLSAGWSTIIMNRYLIDTIPPMVQKGGLTDSEYKGNGRHFRFLQLATDWPNCFQVKVQEDGSSKLVHNRVWSSFKQRPRQIRF